MKEQTVSNKSCFGLKTIFLVRNVEYFHETVFYFCFFLWIQDVVIYCVFDEFLCAHERFNVEQIVIVFSKNDWTLIFRFTLFGRVVKSDTLFTENVVE